MRETHEDQIERWARFMKENPHTWKEIHTNFINAIFNKHDDFVRRLLKSPSGKEKFEMLYKHQ